jgi:IclR family transcriptional regulator, KDG regulon repressor
MPRVSGEREPGVQAVVLALRVIEHLAGQQRPVGVTALAEALGTTKSRIFRHLQTLVQQRYLAQDPETERYGIGPRIMALGRLVGDGLDLVGAAMPVLRDLRDALGHFSVVSQVEPEGVRVLATVSGRSQVQIGVKRGSLLSYHGSAQGKVALAFGDPALRERVMRSRLEMLTPHTIASPAALERELATIARQGWGTGFNESLIGLNTLAAPIFDASGACIGAVGIVDSIQFLEATVSDEQVRQIVAAGRRISESLGHHPGA